MDKIMMTLMEPGFTYSIHTEQQMKFALIQYDRTGY